MILVLHGQDQFRLRQKLAAIKQKFTTEVDPSGYNITTLQGKDSQAADLLRALQTAPFLAKKRLVILHSLQDLDISAAEEKNVAQALESALLAENILVVLEEKIKKGKLLAIALRSDYLFEFKPYTPGQLAGFLQQKLNEAGVQLDPQLWQKLLSLVQDDLSLALLELDKLINYAKAKGLARLTLEQGQPLIALGHEDNIFALLDQISQGQVKKALASLQQQLTAGDHPLQILTMLTRQLRLIVQVKDGLAQGQSAQEIATIYKVHPFVVKKLTATAQKFKQDNFKTVYALMLDLDQQIKTSAFKPEYLLQQALTKICQAFA